MLRFGPYASPGHKVPVSDRRAVVLVVVARGRTVTEVIVLGVNQGGGRHRQGSGTRRIPESLWHHKCEGCRSLSRQRLSLQNLSFPNLSFRHLSFRCLLRPGWWRVLGSSPVGHRAGSGNHRPWCRVCPGGGPPPHPRSSRRSGAWGVRGTGLGGVGIVLCHVAVARAVKGSGGGTDLLRGMETENRGANQ